MPHGEDELKEALALVANGISKREAARRTGVPESTISAKIKNNSEIICCPGPAPFLNSEWEARIHTWAG